TKYYRAGFNIFRACIIVSLLAALVAGGTIYYSRMELTEMEAQIVTLRDIITSQKATIEEMGEENAELINRNEILQVTVGKQEVEAEAEAEIKQERAIPNGCPLTDSAEIEEQDEEITQAEDYVPIVIFLMSDISDVVAAGDGVVTSVYDDSIYGNCIVIDHGNGYLTYYRNAATPKVCEGDEVVRGAILYVGGLEENRLGYQISYMDQFTDPMELMDISG
ncbi:MAG: M23 family metallopeptidase, partial [Lachnospiraceae bacterium]|nr:M23 family metallopeptidase [Lachnospiraceae bacterium]